MKARRKSTKSIKSNIGRKFIIFIKPIDNDGMVMESLCGWFTFKNYKYETCFSMKDAQVFEEKEPGHGSYLDWKKFIEDDNPSWRLPDKPTYLDEISNR